MRKPRHLAAERLNQFDLRAAIGDVVFAANDMGDIHIQIIDHTRQCIQPCAIGAANNRVGQA